MASELIGKLDIMNPYPRHKLSPEDTKRLRKFRQSVSKKLKTKFYDLPDDWRTAKASTTIWLFKEHKYNFDLWWTPDVLEISKWATHIAKLPSKFFDDWFDPETWDWKRYSSLLSCNHADRFDDWWDPDKWNWDMYSAALAYHVSHKFEVWWDSDKWNWDKFGSLAEYCKDHFDTWWMVDRITPTSYAHNCGQLAEFCGDRFETWWRKNLFTYDWQSRNGLLDNCGEWMHVWWKDDEFSDRWWRDNSCYMAQRFPDKFHIWWNKKKFNYAENDCVAKGNRKPCGRHYLMRYCPSKFDKWWDRQRIRPNQKNYELIEEHCQEFKIKWAAEMIIYELGKDIAGGQTNEDDS
jgi:hypothetical protein